MDVFLVPTGRDRHALYFESLSGPPVARGMARRTISTWAVDVFRRALAEGEAARKAAGSPAAPRHGRIRRAITTRLAEAVAEQRLLWHLRTRTAARLIHPDDLPEAQALGMARALLEEDARRHRMWMVIDAALAVACLPVALVPGPNVLGYYFVFRAVGHLFAMRGARRGLRGIVWLCRPAPHLTSLRAALALPPDERARRVATIGGALGLDRLVAFIEDTVPSGVRS
jgi:hypothetical protein